LELPVEYVKTVWAINRDAVIEALKAGTELAWAHFGERGTFLKIK
jgi:hypothetical protein